MNEQPRPFFNSLEDLKQFYDATYKHEGQLLAGNIIRYCAGNLWIDLPFEEVAGQYHLTGRCIPSRRDQAWIN